MAEEEVVVVTGVMRGGVRMVITGGTPGSEVEDLMEVVLLAVVEEVARGGAAVVVGEGTNTFHRLLNGAVEVEEVQEAGAMDKIGVEWQSLQAPDIEVPGSPFHQIGMIGSPQHQHQQSPPQQPQCLHVVKVRRLRGLPQVRPLVSPNR